MADVTEMRAYRENSVPIAADISAPSDETEKASLRLVASLMTFGPRATTRQFDATVRRRGKRSMRAHKG